jgi:hypothetical protein
MDYDHIRMENEEKDYQASLRFAFEKNKPTTVDLMVSIYSGESIVDIEEDVFDSLQDLPVDEYGFITGEIEIIVRHKQHDTGT